MIAMVIAPVVLSLLPALGTMAETRSSGQAAAEQESAPKAAPPMRLAGGTTGFLRNPGAGGWEVFGFVVHNLEPHSVTFDLCPDKIARYSLAKPDQQAEAPFAIDNGAGRWSRECQSVTLAPGQQIRRGAFFEYGDQDGRKRLFVLDTGNGQMAFVARRDDVQAPILGYF